MDDVFKRKNPRAMQVVSSTVIQQGKMNKGYIKPQPQYEFMPD
jgi:hypothetical protein